MFQRPSGSDERWPYPGFAASPGAMHRGLVHSRCADFLLDVLEMIEPRDREIELVAFLLGELRFHLGDGPGALRPVALGRRGRDVGKHGGTVIRDFREPAEHDDFLLGAAGRNRQDTRADRRDDRSMSGQNAEIAFPAGDVNLIDFAGEGELFGRNQIEVEGGHGKPANREWRIASGEEGAAIRYSLFAIRPSYAASAASFLPFSPASSMVPTI